jgi:tripartite-type tricarboxylate transporter receptor subunit TctC
MKRCVAGLLCAAGLLPTHAHTQTWPTQTWPTQTWPARPVRIVVPFSAAGTADLLARIAADKLSAALGEPFVVEDRPGAGGGCLFNRP